MFEHLAIYFPHFDPRPAGLGVYVDQVCGRMIQHASRVSVFTETPEAIPSHWSTVQIEPIPSGRFQPGPYRHLARQTWLQTALPARLARSTVEALFIPFHDGCIAPTRPQFVVIHDLTPLAVPSEYFHPLARWHMRHILPTVLRRSSAVVAVSEHTKLDLQRVLSIDAASVTVVGEGYDRAVFARPQPDDVRRVCARYGLDRPFLLYAGTYAAHKNTGLLADVLDGLRARGHEIDLVLCGRPDAGDMPRLRDALARRQLEDHVRLLGYVDASDLSVLMNAAVAFLYPSKYEGFGLAALEAMASGAVVIASTAASVPEVVGEGGLLLPPADAEAWVVTVERMLRDDREAARIRAAAVRRADRFHWDLVSDALAALMLPHSRGTRSKGGSAPMTRRQPPAGERRRQPPAGEPRARHTLPEE